MNKLISCSVAIKIFDDYLQSFIKANNNEHFRKVELDMKWLYKISVKKKVNQDMKTEVAMRQQSHKKIRIRLLKGKIKSLTGADLICQALTRSKFINKCGF